MTTFHDEIVTFLTRDRIDEVRRTGDPAEKTYTVKFSNLDIKERGWKGDVHLSTIQNSPLNRRLNLENPATLIDKIRYAFEIVGGVASIGEIPVSYIYTLEEELNKLCLYMKDRGHIMYTLTNTAALRLNKSTWTKVVDSLGDGRGSTRMKNLIKRIKETVNTMSNTQEISVKDMMGAEMCRRLDNLELAIRVTIESLHNHQQEMDKINNSNNRWTAHNYGMLELRSLNSLVNPTIDLDRLYDAVLGSKVMQSETSFLGGRLEWLRQNAGHEDEILYYFAGAWTVWGDDDREFDSRWKAYEKVTDIPLRKKLYSSLYDNDENTDSLLETLEFIDKVGKCPDWRRLIGHITKTATLQEKGTTNLKALTPAQPRSALKYLDIVRVLKKKGKWGSNIQQLVQLVVNEAIALLEVPESGLPVDNPIILSLMMESTSAETRHEHFFEPLFTNVLHQIKGQKVQRSGRAAKTDKLAMLSGILAEADMPESFPVMDRVRTDHYQITQVNLATGEGFELGHIKAGTQSTEDNIFLQFKKDNKFQSAFDTHPDHWGEYLKWVNRVYKNLEEVSREDQEAYENTVQFCQLLRGQLI